MAGLNMHQTEQFNESVQPEVGSLEAQLRLREEIERQLEVERQAAQAMAQNRLEQEKLLRQAKERALRQDEEFLQRQSTSRRATKQTRNRRPYAIDALMLCAVTLGMGALLGPVVHPAPSTYPGAGMLAPIPSTPMPPAGLMNGPFSWDKTSIDAGGNDWSGSRMRIDREVTLSDGRVYVEGHADWDVSGDYVGSEQFSGSYDPSSGRLDVIGNTIEQTGGGTPVNLVPGEYTATVGADGHMYNGYMKGAPGVSAIPGPFGGSQVTP